MRTALPAAITQLYLSPDGALHGSPLSATLPEDEAGRWATDQFGIAMHPASARDLLPRPEPAPPAPDRPSCWPLRRGRAPAALAPLPGAHAEGTTVAALFAGSILLAGAEATPAALAAAVSPRLLHIATHALTPAEPDLAANDRLRRSGLALAGASRPARCLADRRAGPARD